jgi:translocation and assembly module TamB
VLRLVALGLLALVLLLLAVLGGSAWLAWRHPAALPWLLQRLPGLQTHEVRGSLASGQLQIGRLDWQLPANAGRLQLWDLQIAGARLVLWPRPGAQAALTLRRVQAARAQYDSPPASGQPLQAPTSLRLPIDLVLQQLAVDALQIDALPAMRQLRASLVLGADGGRLHRVTGLQLQLETGTAEAPAPLALAGQLQIGTDAPLDLVASLQARRDATQATPATPATPAASATPATSATPAWQATLAARGPLARLQAEARLSGAAPANGSAPSLQASGTLLPFASWPLGALQLQTEGLDLAVLSPRLPRTRLAGQATLQTQGLDRPATLAATLDNSQPGTWDSGRLPLRRLQLRASGQPDQTDRLTLEQFQLQLGDAAGSAGRISGEGSWQGATLALRLQAEQLLPARLHRSAAAIVLSGPLTLRASGLPTVAAPAPGAAPARPAVALDGTLSGRWQDGSGLPVQLRLVAEASAQHLLLTQAEARAGTALARLSGQARADSGGWRIAGQATLADFDPRPWWRGPEGSAWRRGPHRLQAEASAKLLWRPLPAARADGLAIDRLLAAMAGEARLVIRDSLLAGVPLAGELALQSQGAGAQLQGELTLGGNRFSLQGQGGAAASADRWDASLQAPTLATLLPLRALLAELSPASADALTEAWPGSGSLQATLQTQGRWPALQSQGTLQAGQLSAAAFGLQQASLRWRQGVGSNAPLQVDLNALGLRGGGQRLDSLALTLTGSLAAHRIRLRADSPLRPPAWTENLLGPAGTGTQLEAEADGQWLPGGPGAGAPLGRYRLRGLGLSGGARQAGSTSRPWLSAQDLAAELQLDGSGLPQALQLAPGRVQLPGTALRWQTLGWTAGAGSGELVLAAELETIDVARLLSRLQPDIGWRGDLTLGGQIDIRSNASGLDADIVLARGQGDLSVTDDLGQPQALGLTDLRLALDSHGGRWRLAQGLVGRRIGSLVGAVELTNPPGQRWPQPGAALQGLLEARVANLGVWGAWVPPGWRLSGAMDAVVQFAGTLGAPRITGSMRGTDLGLRNVLEGVNLTDGQLALQFTGEQARIERLRFQGGDGRLDISGSAELGASPRLALQLVAERFRLLGRIDRRVVASGRAALSLAERRLQIDGDLRVDEGLIDIGRGDAPTLDADVRVQRGSAAALPAAAASDVANQAATKAANGAAAAAANAAATAAANGPPPTPVQVQMQVRINLGDKLQLRGQGVETRLRGDLVLSSPGNRLAINGSVSTEDGRYAAYGQKLEITRGRFIFSGEPGNPRIDVLAIRPNLDMQVGVLVDGNAQNPRIRLYSDPEMADYDKLSWLVLGRSPDGLGSADTALLQRAAFALLAGNTGGPSDQLLQAIGLTDFSLRQTEGDTRDTIIMLGRQLSRRWYVGYERGVHATTGTWQLIYRIAQRFTLRAQSGSENAIDLIWTWRW